MKTSTLDIDVHKILTTTQSHDWEYLDVNGVKEEYCMKCGKKKDHVRKEGTDYQYLPCRGFISGL